MHFRWMTWLHHVAIHDQNAAEFIGRMQFIELFCYYYLAVCEFLFCQCVYHSTTSKVKSINGNI